MQSVQILSQPSVNGLSETEDVFHDSVDCSILKCTDDFGVQYTFPSQWRCLKPWAVPPGLRLMRYSMAEI